jgi:phosphoribosylformimino-5-aminoimidazole carboxamide ribonucleotide (ProFAR) isomerase
MGSLESRCRVLRGSEQEIIVDSVTRSLFKTGIDKIAVSTARSNFDGPIIYSGGISCLSDVDWLMGAGVDRVSICSSLTKPSLVDAIADKYGSQMIIGTFAVSCPSHEERVSFWKNMARDPLAIKIDQLNLIVDKLSEVNIFMIENDGLPLQWSRARRTIEIFRSTAAGTESKLLLQGGIGESSFYDLGLQVGAQGIIVHE